jgi:hypothetical protein
VVVPVDGACEGGELGFGDRPEAGDLGLPIAPGMRVAARLAAVLGPCQILADLLDEAQVPGQRRQARVGRGMV